jgi:hypothetical protein
MKSINELSFDELVKIAQEPVSENPQLEKEKLIRSGYSYLKSIVNSDSRCVFSHDTILIILARFYYIKPKTVGNILYGNYDSKRNRNKRV